MDRMPGLYLAIGVYVIGCADVSGLSDFVATESGTTSATSTGGGGSGGEGGAGGAPWVCGMDVAPPSGMCPAECTGGCDDGTCNIDCTMGGMDCEGETVDCPAGFACEVDCRAENACRQAEISCPAAHACIVRCDTAGDRACEDAFILCSADGTCEVECGPDSQCAGPATLECGGNRCSATCMGSTQPDVECNDACECTPCP